MVAVVAVTESEVVVLPAGPVDELARLAARCAALAAENEHLWGETVRLTAENERLRGRVGKLEVQLEESRRAGKRQAAPFSRGERIRSGSWSVRIVLPGLPLRALPAPPGGASPGS